MRRILIGIATGLVPVSAAAAEPAPLLNIEQYVLPPMRELLPGFLVTDTGAVLHVVAPNGAAVDMPVPFPRARCAQPERCGRDRAKILASILKPPVQQELRLRLETSAPVATVADDRFLPWSAPAFGPFLRVCYKGDTDNARPLTRWDAEMLGTSLEALAAKCEQTTREALQPLDGRALARSASNLFSADGGTIVAPNASARLLFPDQWADLANAFGGALTVVAAERDIVIYVKGGDSKAAGSAVDAARDQVRKARRSMARLVLPLCMDAWRWDGGSWTLMTPHPAADIVVAAVKADFPDRHVRIIDADTVAFEGQGRQPMSLLLRQFSDICRAGSEECRTRVQTWMQKTLYPILRGEREGFSLP